MKKNQKGFSAVELILILILIALIGGVGYFVYQRQNKDTKKASTEQSTEAADANEVSTTKYCDPIEKACISYDSSWDTSLTTAKDDEGVERTEVALSNSKYKGLKVNFRPYMGGVGGGCQEGVIVAALDVAKAKDQKVVQSYSKYQEIQNEQPVGDLQYIVGMSVQSGKDKAYVTVGSTDCLGLGLYEYPAVGNAAVGKLGVLSAQFTNKTFTKEQEAKDVFNSAEAKAALKVLQSLEFN